MRRGSVASRGARSRPVPERRAEGPRAPDSESGSWLVLLRSEGSRRRRAIARLHGLLLGAAGFEVARRRARTPHLGAEESGEIALQAAADALVAVLSRLDDYRGESRFTTWASKFALFEAAVAVRRRAWQERGLPGIEEVWSIGVSRPPVNEGAAARELLSALQEAIRRVLSDQQREVYMALALHGVPIDVLAERRGTTRGALYTSLHEARRALRTELRRQGLDPPAGCVED
jgi:RNA polymerase sigma-70 factor, ECF subfamily